MNHAARNRIGAVDPHFVHAIGVMPVLPANSGAQKLWSAWASINFINIDGTLTGDEHQIIHAAAPARAGVAKSSS